MLLDAMDSYPEGYIPCNCHPETCCHKDQMIFVGTQKPLADEISAEGRYILKILPYLDTYEQCCDNLNDVNNTYINKVFQWLIDNDYHISKKIR